MGFVALLMPACGMTGSDDPKAPKVADADAGLEASTDETPDNNPAVQGRGGGLTAVLFIDPAAGTARLQVTRGGATIESDRPRLTVSEAAQSRP